MKNLIELLKTSLFVFLLSLVTLGAVASDSEEEDFYSIDPDELSPALSKEYIRQNIQRSGNEQQKEQVITLDPCESPLIVGESASLSHRNIIEKHKAAGFDWFGLSYPERIVDWQDHGYHYLTGQINKSVFNKTRTSNINYLILGIDAVVIMRDEHQHCYLDRITKPLLFDRTTGQITLTETDITEYLVFLSYPSNRKNDYKKVVKLSESSPFPITDLQGKGYKVCFYPTQVSEGTEEFRYISSLFPKLHESKNFDSEVHAVYALLQNLGILTSFVQSIPGMLGFARLGLRYYSFLDTCGRCREFLLDNQSVLKQHFMNAVYTRFPMHIDIPFLSFAHNNRIYRNNKYQSIEGAAVIEAKMCEHVVAGGEQIHYVAGEISRYKGTIIPKDDTQNRLIAHIYEPDLGKDDEFGIVRQYFAHLSSLEFENCSFKDGHAAVLSTRLRRMNPLELKVVNLSGNQFGIDIPDYFFEDDGILLTRADDLAEVIRSLGVCSRLEVLNLSNSAICNSHPLLSLRHSLKKWPELRQLILSDVHMSREDFQMIGEQLRHNTKLEALNIDRNFIYYEGAQLLSSLIPNLPFLKELRVAYCALCHQDTRERADDPDEPEYNPDVLLTLEDAVSSHPTLSVFDISHYTVQIRKEDLKNFVRKVKQKKPSLSIIEKRKVF